MASPTRRNWGLPPAEAGLRRTHRDLLALALPLAALGGLVWFCCLMGLFWVLSFFA